MDGIIIVNKPKKLTSHDIVYKVKKTLGEKVGHTGTLDPMATGVLPLLVGKGTLVSKYLINHDKVYKVQMQLGKKTETADVEGEIIEEIDVPNNILKKDIVEETLKTFLGKQEQTPPIYSAIKVNGKKLYEYARKGQTVEIQKRQIEIYSIELEKIDKDRKQIEFIVKCSKGTYIRSLCEDIAKKLGNIAYMSELNRIEVGEFNISESIEIEELQKNKENQEYIDSHFISIEKLFEKNEKIRLNTRKIELVLNGVKITYEAPNGLYKIYDDTEKFIGIGIIKDNLLKRDVII